jgi:hypothetical protein
MRSIEWIELLHKVFLKGKPPTLIEYLASKAAGKLYRKTLQENSVGKLCSGKTSRFCHFRSYSGEYKVFWIA